MYINVVMTQVMKQMYIALEHFSICFLSSCPQLGVGEDIEALDPSGVFHLGGYSTHDRRGL